MEEKEVKNGKKVRGIKFYLKVLLVFTLLLGASMAIAIYYVYHRLSTDSELEKIIGAKISAATGLEVKFTGIEMSFPSIMIKDIEVATTTPDVKLAASIARLDVTPDFLAALKGELVLDSISVASGVTNLELTAGKDVAPTTQKAPQKPLELGDVKLPFRNVSLSNLRFNVKTVDVAEPYQLTLSEAGISRALLSSSLPFYLKLEEASLAAVALEGSIDWPDNVTASLKVTAKDIEKLKKLVPSEYQQHLTLIKSAASSAEIKYSLKDGSIRVSKGLVALEPGIKAEVMADIASMSPVNATATFKLSPLQVDTLWPIIKEYLPAEHELSLKNGSVSAEGEVALIADKPLSLSVKLVPDKIRVNAKALPEPVELERGQVSYQNGKIGFSGFSARIAESHLQLSSGELKLEPLSFSGEVSADANFVSIWKVVAPFLSEDAKRVTPSGAASFKGKILYNEKGPRVDGRFSSDRITLAEKQTSTQASIENIRVRLEGLGDKTGKIHVESLEAAGIGSRLKLGGVLTNAADIALDFSADGNVKIDEFVKTGAILFKLPIKPGQFKGELVLAMKIAGSLSDVKPKGRLELKNVHVDMSDRGFVLTKLNGAASADLDKLVLDKVAAEVFGGKVSIDGSLNDFKKPQFDAMLAISNADLGQIRAMIARNVPEMPKEIEISGRSDLKVKIGGSFAKPDIDGSAALNGVRFFHPAVYRPLEKISGPVKLTHNGLSTTGIQANWGTSQATVNGELKDWGKLLCNFKFSVKPLDATDAAGFFLKDTGYVLDGKGSGNGTITGPLEKIKVAGAAVLPAGVVSAPVSENGDVFKFPFQNLNASFVYHEAIFSVTSAELAMFRGKIKGNGKVFLASEPIRFEFASNIDNLMSEDFLKQNTKYPGMLTGAINGGCNGKGDTLGLASLNGDAKLGMPKGTYNSPPFLKQIAKQLNVPQLASGTIDNVSGDYKIANGRISSNNVLAKAGEDRVTFVGSVGLDTTLDGEARFQLNRKTALKSNVLRELIGNEPSVEIPVTIKGTFMSPSVGIPLERMLKEAAERRAKSAVKKEAGKVLDRLFGGKKQATPATASATAAPAQKPAPKKNVGDQLKDLGKNLKNLFR